MNEPRRLLEQGRRDLASRLLRSASADGPDQRSVARALSAVAIAAGTASAASSASASTSVLAGVLKWLGLGIVAGSVVALGADRIFAPADRAAPPVALSSVARAARETPTAIVTAEPSPAAEVFAPVVSRAPSVTSARGAVSREAPEAAPAASADPEPAAPPPSLGDELRAIDGARSRLAAGNAAAALEAIDRYEREFPRARLAQEAALVRIEALAAAGRCSEAKAAASGFLERHPKSVLAQRARSLISRCR